MTGTAAAQTDGNTTADEVCEPGEEEPKLQDFDIGGEALVAGGSPGTVGMSFTPDATANCDLKIQVILSGDTSGVSISGFSDAGSAAGSTNTVSSIFTARPEAGTRSISADVYATETGEYTFTGDIQYWPVGHSDMAKEADGNDYTISVEDPVQKDGSSSDDENTASAGSSSWPLTPLMTSIIGLILVGTVLAVGASRNDEFNFDFSFGKK